MGFLANAKQRRALELRAMEVATAHFLSRGATVRDVSANHPYDLLVEQDGVVATVEVKGTMGEGTEILLTRGEVAHHRVAYPNNALVVVSGIRLDGPPEAPDASGGELRLVKPWSIDDAALASISYRYVVPGHPLGDLG